MLRNTFLGRALTVVAVAGGLAFAAVSPAVATADWTAITTPSADTFLDLGATGSAHLAVAGAASDASAVAIYCIHDGRDGPQAEQLAASVPVTNGHFSTTVALTAPQPPCRLRAVPANFSPTGYLASYTGPMVYVHQASTVASGATTYGFEVDGAQPGGFTSVQDAARCGVMSLASATGSSPYVGAVPQTCLLGIAEGRIPVSGPRTQGALTVDGHTAYLPAGIVDLIGAGDITSNPPTLTTKVTFGSGGGFTATESAPLERCTGTDAYPPVAGTCPTLAGTGVRFTRTTTFTGGGHELVVRDAFASTDALAHAVGVEYSQDVEAPITGDVGYLFPGRTSFSRHGLGGTVTGLGTHAGTVLIRSDVYATADDPDADTLAVSWSRPPAGVRFDPTTANTFGARFALSVPARGAARLGFAVDERVFTSAVRTLAARAVAAMVAAPHITSPASGARLRSRTITVRGALATGANGLPTKVIVNGARATLTAAGGFSARIRVSGAGWHVLTVRAYDVVGNARSSAIRVHTP